jgi:hypothetical protein
MTKKTTLCRLAIEVPARLALMPPNDFESHVRAHWTEWRNRWRQVNGQRTPDAMFEVRAGEPMYLIEQSGRHYLVTEGTKVEFAEAS